jgi:hypothetical protein
MPKGLCGFQKGNKWGAIRDYSEEELKKRSIANQGENNPRWAGGKLKTQGYIRIWKSDHPFADAKNYIMEHRLVMEQFLGRYLAPEEVVHHINGIKNDNRIENLMLFANNAEHQKFHMNL